MKKKIWFFSVWSIILAVIFFGYLISVHIFNWVLFLHIPMLFFITVSSYFAIINNTNKSWIVHFVIEFIALFIAFGLVYFIDDIFNYDRGGMFPGFAYLMEGIYSYLAAFVFTLNLFVTSIIFFISKKRPFLGVITFIIELIISIILFTFNIWVTP